LPHGPISPPGLLVAEQRKASIQFQPRNYNNIQRRLKMRNLIFSLFLAGAGVISGPTYAAGEFPSRTVKVLNQFGPGGGADTIVRPLLDKVGAEIKTPFVMEYKPGASGVIAAGELEAGAADGHTLIIDTQTLSLNTVLRKVSYKHAQWEPVALLGVIPLGLLARKDFAVKNIPELITYAKNNPGKVTYGTLGPGSAAHLAALLFEKEAGVRLMAVPYKATMDIHQDLMGERIDLFFDGVSQALPRHRDNQLKILGVTTSSRISIAPSIPTMVEQGVNLVVGSWFGISAPPVTPKAVVARLSDAFFSAAGASEYQDRMRSLGIISVPLKASAFADFRKEDLEKWRAVVKSSDLKVE
jgi:tripartite-type tricarboxylate transporter receptor subunit TctC